MMNKPDVAMSNAAQLETWKDLSTSNTAKRVEELPFRVIPVNSKDELDAVARIRHHAYGRHLPQFAQSLALPESGVGVSSGTSHEVICDVGPTVSARNNV